MAFLRFIAWVLLLIAAIALVQDVTRANSTGQMVFTSLLAHWKAAAPASLAATTAFLQRWVHPAVWDPMLVRVLVLPAWSVIGALGLLCALLGRRKRRVNIYAN